MVVQKGTSPPHHGAMSTFCRRIKSARHAPVLSTKRTHHSVHRQKCPTREKPIIFLSFASSSTIDTFAPPQTDHSGGAPAHEDLPPCPVAELPTDDIMLPANRRPPDNPPDSAAPTAMEVRGRRHSGYLDGQRLQLADRLAGRGPFFARRPGSKALRHLATKTTPRCRCAAWTLPTDGSSGNILPLDHVRQEWLEQLRRHHAGPGQPARLSHLGHPRQFFVVALDQDDGKELWRVDLAASRPSTVSAGRPWCSTTW